MTQVPVPEIRTTLRKIPLGQIRLADDTFSTNFMPDLRPLRSSLKTLGLLEPVLLREKSGGYQVISGFRRLTVLHELGVEDAESRIIETPGVEDRRLFDIALHQNLTTRSLNAVETAIALHKLVHQFRMEPRFVTEHHLSLLGLETNEKILGTFLSLAAMEEEVKEYVIREEVSRSNIRKLATFVPEDRQALIPFLSSMKLGENRLREVLTLLEEISRRDQRPVGTMVRNPEIQAVAHHQKLTPSQRTERVKRILMRLRYPRLNQLEERFEKERKQLHLPPGISLDHYAHFESRGTRMELQFATLEEYRSLLSALAQLPDQEAFRKLLEQE